MSKRFLLIMITLFCLTAVVLPAAAQDKTSQSATDFVPASFAGFITVKTTDLTLTLQSLNEAIHTAALLQPLRVNSGITDVLTYYDFIPFGTWFDLEQADFAGIVSPWLGQDMVIGYRKFDAGLTASNNDILLIMSNTNVLDATSRIEKVLKGQDLPQRETYRGITIYEGDKASFAMTIPAVFVGPVDLIKAALDVQAGEAASLTADPIYHTVHAAQPADTFVSAYVNGTYVMSAVNGLLNGDPFSAPVLKAFGGALSIGQNQANFSQLLLNGGIDAAEVNLVRGKAGQTVSATAIFHPTEPTDLTTTAVDPALLKMMPRSSLLVHSGTDFRAFVGDAITALPVANFASQLIGGLPFETAGSFQNDLVTDPNASDVKLAVDSFVSAIKQTNGDDVQKDILDHLTGGYALSLLPRPNFRLPILNVPFDFILVGQVDDGPKTQDSIVKVLTTIFGLQSSDQQIVGDWTFKTMGLRRDIVFQVGYQRNMIMVSTSRSATLALDAARGDNRLVNMDRWTQFPDTTRPDLYLDAFVFYNTFFPQFLLTGGVVVSAQRRERVMLTSQSRDDGLFQLNLTATVPR